MTDPAVHICHDLTHRSGGATIVAKLHHHAGGRVEHSRFGHCRWCFEDWPLYGAPVEPDDEPTFPAQRCPSCGAEHPGQPCAAYDGDLFGGAL